MTQVPDLKNAVEQIAVAKHDTLEIKPEVSSRILQFITQAGLIAGAGTLATLPAAELNVGGGALLACGMIVADLQTTGGKGPAAKAAEKIFGSVPNALQTLGLTACVALGGGTFYRMLQDGGIRDHKDPRWLIVAANAAPYLAGSVMQQPQMKAWVENRFGKTIDLAYRQEGKIRHMTVDTVPFYQQLAFAMGAAHIIAFGLIKGDITTTMIGTSFLAAPVVSAGNMLNPVSDAEAFMGNHAVTRRGFLTATANLAVKPFVKADVGLLFENVMAMVGRGQSHASRTGT